MKDIFRKTGLAVFLLAILFSFFGKVHAMPVPFFYVDIVTNSVDGDAEFNYDLNSEKFKIQTENGSGNYSDNVFLPYGGDVYLTQATSSDWQISNIVCTSSNPEIAITPNQNGVVISARTFDSVTCTFTNTKAQKKTPVIIVPGVMGTEIKNGDELLWADLGRMFTDIGDDFMDSLAFTKDLKPIDNNVVFSDVIKSKFAFDYSDQLVKDFESQGYTEGTSSNATLFTFPYDWRYGVGGVFTDGKTNTDLLKQKIQEVMNQTGSNKVDIIAHSTGGLLVKKYVMDNSAENHIDKAVFVGVPNLGAPKAIKVLLQGDSMGVPWLADSEIQKISQNLPIIYDLSPSQQYYDILGSYMRVGALNDFNPSYNDLTFSQTTDYLKGKGFNFQAIASSSDLHSAEFDNYDLRSAGVDLYNIVGCKTGTIGQILDSQDINGNHLQYDPNFNHEFSGDGTVPFGSADSLLVDTDKTFFAIKADHGKMISQDGIRQEIVNLLTGSNLDTDGKILTHDAVKTNPKLCEIKGEKIKIKSPVNIGVTDQFGNFSGLANDGSIQNDIPGADYEIWGEHKYVFLPTDEGQIYNVILKGTGTGTFTLDDQSIDGDNITQTRVFSNIPVTPDLTGKVNLRDDSNQITLSLQATPTSIPIDIAPSSIINSQESQDLTPPVSTSTISGTIGDPSFYRSDVKINLSAIDPIINNDPSQTSGVLKTQYNLDSQGYKTYSSTTKILISNEGFHTVSFFSTDRAGNNEEQKTVNFVIDKTAPEFIISFNLNIKDIQFSGIDNISTSSIKIYDKDDVITITDQAGNKAEIKLKDKNRKNLMTAEIKSISYNGILADISKNLMNFYWKVDKNKNLTFLSQYIISKKSYNILAVYDGKNTSLVGKNSSGIIYKSIKGLQLLKVSTSKGDLSWSY